MLQMHSCPTGETQGSHHIWRVWSYSQQQTCSRKPLKPTILSEWYKAVHVPFSLFLSTCALFSIMGKMQRLHAELPNAILRQVSDSGHLSHVDKPKAVVKLIEDFVQNSCWGERCWLHSHSFGVGCIMYMWMWLWRKAIQPVWGKMDLGGKQFPLPCTKLKLTEEEKEVQGWTSFTTCLPYGRT